MVEVASERMVAVCSETYFPAGEVRYVYRLREDWLPYMITARILCFVVFGMKITAMFDSVQNILDIPHIRSCF